MTARRTNKELLNALRSEVWMRMRQGEDLTLLAELFRDLADRLCPVPPPREYCVDAASTPPVRLMDARDAPDFDTDPGSIVPPEVRAPAARAKRRSKSKPKEEELF
jgi:hypothetical protein